MLRGSPANIANPDDAKAGTNVPAAAGMPRRATVPRTRRLLALGMSRPRLIIAGASGVVGRHLAALASERYDVTVLTRRTDGPFPRDVTPVAWRPDAVRAGDQEALSRLTSVLDGAAALVNLAGASISDGRLGRAHVDRLIASRVDSTTTLVTAMRRCRRPPAVLVQGSATGIYGQKGDDLVDETAAVDESFVLAPVARAWEAAAAPANAVTRTCVLRIGVVLAPDAPAWQQLLLPVRLGVGGRFGSGEQWWSWIDADDLARAALHLIDDDSCHGVFNAVAPEPVRQEALGRAMARRLRRPFWFGMPAWLLRLALGRLADAALLQSARVVPTRLLESGFTFERASLDAMIDRLLPPR